MMQAEKENLKKSFSCLQKGRSLEAQNSILVFERLLSRPSKDILGSSWVN